jgi:BirA family biotin operon repressor/biotin-[acetyl-CoA-carboxylase] ligase
MQLLRFDSVDSTNEQAKRLRAAGRVQSLDFVIAREQTAGRGTRGRAWDSPRDAGIYLSMIELPRRKVTRYAVLHTLAAGIACAEALERSAGLPVRLKAVNDLCVDGRKLGGILTEVVVEEGSLVSVIVGVGINVRSVPRTVAPGAAASISVEEILGPDCFARVRLGAVVAALIVELTEWHDLAAHGAIDRIRLAWERRSAPESGFPDLGPAVGNDADRVPDR